MDTTTTDTATAPATETTDTVGGVPAQDSRLTSKEPKFDRFKKAYAEAKAFKAANPDIEVAVVGEKFAAAVRSPSKATFRAFRAEAGNPATKPGAQDNLVQRCLLFPDGATWLQWLELAPALGEKYAVTVYELAGGDEDQKKVL